MLARLPPYVFHSTTVAAAAVRPGAGARPVCPNAIHRSPRPAMTPTRDEELRSISLLRLGDTPGPDRLGRLRERGDRGQAGERRQRQGSGSHQWALYLPRKWCHRHRSLINMHAIRAPAPSGAQTERPSPPCRNSPPTGCWCPRSVTARSPSRTRATASARRTEPRPRDDNGDPPDVPVADRGGRDAGGGGALAAADRLRAERARAGACVRATAAGPGRLRSACTRVVPRAPGPGRLHRRVRARLAPCRCQGLPQRRRQRGEGARRPDRPLPRREFRLRL